MRVISGSARRINLIVPDSNVRPTTDRTKETLFNMINSELPGAIVLDLFAGSGALGIESLSRGAKFCYFGDSYKQSNECIKTNLQHTKLVDKAKVFRYDYIKTLETLSKEEIKCHVIFIDPPYNMEFENSALKLIDEYNLLKDDGIIIIESDIKTIIDDSTLIGFNVYKTKKYKTNKFTFIQKEVE